MNCADFALFDRLPSDFALPCTDADAQRIVREAAGRAILLWGGGTRQHVGHPPVRYDLALSTCCLDKIIDYQPADLTVTVQAGVTLAELQAALASKGQWLPLDIALPERQTIGGMVAGRPHGLRRFAFGSVRDSLIGVKVVDHRGDLIVGGGRVVKNVSGYDLPKLYCGSWGTLGLIMEATFKVAPRPEASAVVVLPLSAERNAEDALDRLLESDLEPSFLWLMNPGAARLALSTSEDTQSLVIGFDGSPQNVAWQIEALGGPALPAEEAASVSRYLRDFPLVEAAMSVTFHVLSSQVGAFARMVEWTALRAGFEALVAADAAVGIVYAHISPTHEIADWKKLHADLADKALRVGGSCIIERMPPELRVLDVPVWTPLLSDFALMARLKETLDPHRMWNPGRFVGCL